MTNARPLDRLHPPPNPHLCQGQGLAPRRFCSLVAFERLCVFSIQASAPRRMSDHIFLRVSFQMSRDDTCSCVSFQTGGAWMMQRLCQLASVCSAGKKLHATTNQRCGMCTFLVCWFLQDCAQKSSREAKISSHTTLIDCQHLISVSHFLIKTKNKC